MEGSMTVTNMLNLTASPALSILIWVVLFLAALYFARRPFHRAVMSFSKIIYNAMRFTSASVLSAEKRLVKRNRRTNRRKGI
jgi:hypothetical protein